MKNVDERTTDDSVFSYERMQFRYKYARKFFENGTILDIGCGFGYGVQYFEPHRYTGIDYSDQTIEMAKRFHPEVEFQVMEVPPLRFPGNHFDNILCLELIEHVKPPLALDLLRECHRVLKAGGTLFLTTPNATNRGVMPPFHFIEYTTDQMRDMLIQTGFRVKKQGGLWMSIYKNRYKQNAFHHFRARIYASLAKGRGLEKQANQDESLPILAKSRGGLLRRWIKSGMVLLAKIINTLGYIFPSRAEYQAWVVTK